MSIPADLEEQALMDTIYKELQRQEGEGYQPVVYRFCPDALDVGPNVLTIDGQVDLLALVRAIRRENA